MGSGILNRGGIINIFEIINPSRGPTKKKRDGP
jgi:hypothetical protein